jgi:hypothetical protein
MTLVSMPPDREAAYRAGFGTGVAAHGPAEVEGMLDRAGFAATPCFQSALIRGWLAKRR